MLEHWQAKLEQTLGMLLMALIIVLFACILFGFIVFFLCWAAYLLLGQLMIPGYAALCVALLLVLGFVVLYYWGRSCLSEAAKSRGQADPNKSGEGYQLGDSYLNRLSCSLLAGFIYECSPNHRSEVAEIMIHLTKSKDNTTQN